MTRPVSGATRWLAPLMPGIPGVTALDARRMNSFENKLGDLLSAYPIGPSVEPQLRSQRLVRIRRELALGGHLGLAVPARDGGCGRAAATQALMQFICGYRDADLRDATGLGHGRLIALHGTAPLREQWLPRLMAGEVPGIAIIDAHAWTPGGHP
jgi:alkylation response protein AidB-like acyl-CoA dehydrogenase